MHVATETLLSPAEVRRRFEKVEDAPLTYAAGRTPPKFFLSAVPVTLPAAAEVAVHERAQGAEVVLRLMWGPLPAPFPRCLAALSILAGALIVALSGQTPVDLVLGGLLAVLPTLALLYQRQGERQLQARLAKVLGGASFRPKAH